MDVNSWVKPCIVNYDVPEISLEEDLDELQNIFFYQVKWKKIAWFTGTCW